MSHPSHDVPVQRVDRKILMYSQLLAQKVLSSSIRPFLFLLSSCWFSMMLPPDASACRTATCSPPSSSGSSSTSPAPSSIRTLLVSRSRFLSATWLLPPRFSRQSSRLALGIHFYMICKQLVSDTTSTCPYACPMTKRRISYAQHLENSLTQFLAS